jgi:hypothetical protein
MVTQYPANIDNSTTLPNAFNGLTGFDATVVNLLRNAIVAVETALGVNPAGVYTTVRARLDALESTLDTILSGETGSVTVVGTAQVGQAIIWSGSAWVPSTNFVNQSISLNGDITVNAITTVPAVSAPEQGIIYFDATQRRFLVSENGGAYQTLGAADIHYAGDLTGNSSTQTVVGIDNIAVNLTGLATGSPLVYNGSQWVANPNQSITTGPLLSTSITTSLLTANGKMVVNGISPPVSVSSAGQGIVYFDSTQNQFLVSQNGAAYFPLLSFTIVPGITSNTPITSLVDQILLVGTLSSNITITLPVSPVIGQIIFIKDQKGSAGSHPITIAGNSNTIDGNASYVLNVSYESVQLVYGSLGAWSIV